MKLIKIGLGNIDPTVGAFGSNVAKLILRAHEMAEEKCVIGVFSEQCIPGYPVEDLVGWKGFLENQWKGLEFFAEKTSDLDPVFIVGLAVEIESVTYNVAAVVRWGEILGLVPKEKLPTYNVFYEARTYSPGFPEMFQKVRGVPCGDLLFDFPFGRMAVEVCEDIWSPDGPMRRRAYLGAEVIVNISASPFRAGVYESRKEMISTRAADNCALVVYVNQVGGNDGLAFDGGGFVNQCGKMVLDAPRWQEQISTVVVDLDRTSRFRREGTTWRVDRDHLLSAGGTTQVNVRVVESLGDFEGMEEGYEYPFPISLNFFIPEHTSKPNARNAYFEDMVQAMIMGLDGYFRKTGAFDCIGISMSGGKDSALTLLIAYLYATEKRAFKGDDLKKFIRCFSYPTRYNGDETRNLAKNLSENLGVYFKEISISDEVERAERATETTLLPGESLSRIGKQNIQARIRGKRMWDWSNTTRGMWLQTGNMSEKAVGYTTIGGDMMGAYSLLANAPKTVIIELIKYLKVDRFKDLGLLDELVGMPASAELEKDQQDERDLMPFPVLDACLHLFVGEKMMPEEVKEAIVSMFGDDRREELEQWVDDFVVRFQRSIFKWVQTPQSVHLGSLDLDRERALQLPVVQSGEWLK